MILVYHPIRKNFELNIYKNSNNDIGHVILRLSKSLTYPAVVEVFSHSTTNSPTAFLDLVTEQRKRLMLHGAHCHSVHYRNTASRNPQAASF